MYVCWWLFYFQFLHVSIHTVYAYSNSVTLIEIVREVERDGDNLNHLLKNTRVEELEDNCLERALIAAVKTGSHVNVSKLVIKGAKNVDEALGLSVELKKHEVRALLLLVNAAQTNDEQLVTELFKEPSSLSSSSLVYFLLVHDPKKFILFICI